MKRAIITIGVPTSGKSFYANTLISKDPSFVEISRDNIRRELFGIDGWSTYRPSVQNESLVTTREYDLIREASNSGKNIILTDTNIRMKYVRNFVSILQHHGYQVGIKLFDISIHDAMRRNGERSLPANMERLIDMIGLYEETSTKVRMKYRDLIIE